jgi:hypothetical protein
LPLTSIKILLELGPIGENDFRLAAESMAFKISGHLISINIVVNLAFIVHALFAQLSASTELRGLLFGAISYNLYKIFLEVALSAFLDNKKMYKRSGLQSFPLPLEVLVLAKVQLPHEFRRKGSHFSYRDRFV